MNTKTKSVVGIFCALMVAGIGVQADASPGKGAYLGVSTMPLEPRAADEAGLQEGVGLVVEYVDPESGAAEVLEPQDILHKLNDQLLVSHQQLAVLVRGHKPGDTVKIQVIREGHAMEVESKLKEKELPPMNSMAPKDPQIHVMPPIMKSFSMDDWDPRKMMEEIQKSLDGAFKNSPIQRGGGHSAPEDMLDIIQGMKDQDADDPGAADTPSYSYSTTTSVKVMSDGDMTLTLTITDGDKHLKAEDKDGKVLFNGSINTENELANLPVNVSEMYNELDQAGKMEVEIDHSEPAPAAPSKPGNKLST